MALAGRRAAVFLDKDGTLIENVPYNVRPELMKLAPGADSLLRMLADAGFALVVVSNQSGVARGMFEASALDAVEQRLHELVEAAGASLEGVFWCPHHPKALDPALRDCTCRKPAAGMLLRAADELDLDLASSWMVGDILDDVEAGNRAGVRTVLLDIGNETEWVRSPMRIPTATVSDLHSAATIIVRARVPAGIQS